MSSVNNVIFMDVVGPDHSEAAVEVFGTNIGAEPKAVEALRVLSKG